MKVTRTISITSGAAPFHVQVYTCSCAVVPTPSFTAPTLGLYTVTVEFPGNCFETACEVSVLVTDADGCKENLDFLSGIDDPCNELAVEILGTELSFTANPSGGSGVYNYVWAFNPNFFTAIGPTNGPTLLLERAVEFAGPNPPAQNVTVMVVDTNDCTATATRVVEFCAPSAISDTNLTVVPCRNQGFRVVHACQCRRGKAVDWSTFQVTEIRDSGGNIVSGKIDVFSLALNPNFSGSNALGITYDVEDFNLLNQGGEFTVYWRVASEDGIWSNTASFGVSILPCQTDESDPPKVNDCTCNYRTTCSEQNDSRGISFEFDLTNCFKRCDCNDPDREISVESFQIVSGPFVPGGYVIFDPATLMLRYSAPAGSVGVDVVEYIICSESGDCSGISTATIYLNCIALPELEDDFACTNCNLPIVINVLANDSGANIDPSSLTIIDPPQGGTAYIDGNYNIVYTPFSGFNGQDTLTYVVTNFGGQGGFPEPATVTINVSCAGEGEEVTICEPAPFLVSSIETQLGCTTDINKAPYNIILGAWSDYNGTPQALENGDIVKLKSPGIGLNVDLIIGQNPLLPAGYTNDVGGNWAALTAYMTAGTMDASSLLNGTYTIEFDKKGWADANGYHNIYDLTTGAQTQNDALQFNIDTYCVDVSTSQQSTEVSAVIKRVKLNAIEDNTKPGYSRKGSGGWSSADGAIPTEGCGANCVPAPVQSWYSQVQSSCGSPKPTLPPSAMTSYKLSGASQVNLSPGVPITIGSAENDVRNALNSFTSLSFRYVPCNSAALATYGVGGYSSTILASCYLEEDAEHLEYFEITYENETVNDGKTAKGTLDSVILF